jgi:hypothetical protein
MSAACYRASSSSSKVGCCEKACHSFGVLQLQVLNLVDFLLGCVFLVFAIYLAKKLGGDMTDIYNAWIGLFCATSGCLLLGVSLFSFLAITNAGCRCMMAVSKVLALLIVGVNAGAGVSAFVLQKRFYKYLDDNRNTVGITDSDIDIIKQWYLVICCALLVSVILELLRFHLSQGFCSASQRIDGEFGALLQEEELGHQTMMQEHSSARADKYNDLRSYYKGKYANANLNL